MDNLFMQATREKFRFESSKGDLSVEQLWDLPLTSRTGFDLDTVAKAVNADLKASNEESFVNASNNPAVSRLKHNSKSSRRSSRSSSLKPKPRRSAPRRWLSASA